MLQRFFFSVNSQKKKPKLRKNQKKIYSPLFKKKNLLVILRLSNLFRWYFLFRGEIFHLLGGGGGLLFFWNLFFFFFSFHRGFFLAQPFPFFFTILNSFRQKKPLKKKFHFRKNRKTFFKGG